MSKSQFPKKRKLGWRWTLDPITARLGRESGAARSWVQVQEYWGGGSHLLLVSRFHFAGHCHRPQHILQPHLQPPQASPGQAQCWGWGEIEISRPTITGLVSQEEEAEVAPGATWEPKVVVSALPGVPAPPPPTGELDWGVQLCHQHHLLSYITAEADRASKKVSIVESL